MSRDALEIIRTRRVVRNLTEQPVEREKMEKILEAARWAPVAGNQRIHRFVAVQDPVTLKLLRMVSPGMFQRPQSVIVICADWEKAGTSGFSATDFAPYIDLGTVMQTIMLACHAVGLGSGPVTSYSKAGVSTILNLPENLSPEIIVCIGYAAADHQLPMQAKKKVTWQSLTDWERF